MRNNLELMLIESAKISNNDICVITGDEPKFIPKTNIFLLKKLFRIIALSLSHIDLGKKIRKFKDKDAILIYACSTEFLFLTFLFSFWTRNVYLVNNHNVQQAYEKPLMNSILKIYHHLGYKFIVLETASVLMDLGYEKQELSQHISLLHSVVDNSSIATKYDLLSDERTRKKKVGIIGESRQEKNFRNTLDLMLKISRNLDVLLVIGTNDFSSFEGMDLQGAEPIDTSTNDNYLAALSACDAIVLNYEKSKYFYRCSGVAADAIGVQTYVVCPDFPLMSSQVNYPTQVGVVYQDETGLELAIQQALKLTGDADRSVFKHHYIERSPAKAAAIIDRAIQDNS
jgi:hypothetical protein